MGTAATAHAGTASLRFGRDSFPGSPPHLRRATRQGDFRELAIPRERVAQDTAIAGGVGLRFWRKSSINPSKVFEAGKT
jgi:hypothetical protein